MMKAAIFDIDGTLVDSVDLHARAWQEAFHYFGHKFSFEQIRSQIGKGGDQLLPLFLSKDEFESRGEEIQKYRGDLFLRKYMPKIKPFPCVRKLFQSLIARGWKIALASSAKEQEVNIYKKIANVSDLLDSEASSEDANQSKPHPDIFLAAAEHLEAVPQECIAVGDTPMTPKPLPKRECRSLAYYQAASRRRSFAKLDARKSTKILPICFSATISLCLAAR